MNMWVRLLAVFGYLSAVGAFCAANFFIFRGLAFVAGANPRDAGFAGMMIAGLFGLIIFAASPMIINRGFRDF